ncbi:hypothetical protein [Pleomorphovibrio marinus]|uniref:hypothetical protein n=1 Tax=Pleomorphovibrio marinus TaxID=2164132 RepID=UPI000E0AC23F|nr:hypothetical protein [Pleomorphovibrio marinus]
MSFVGRIVAFLFFIGLFSEAFPQSGSLDWLINTQDIEGKNAMGEHPRGLVKAWEVEEIRKRVAYGHFLEILENLERDTQKLAEEISKADEFEAQKVTELAAHYSYLYLLKGDKEFADSAYSHLETVFEDKVIFDNPVSRGLTRAAVLLKMAFTYDFCYQAWTQKQRNEVNRQLYKVIYATSANMGYDANYSLVSNWMGVRWGSVVFASLVWDHPDQETPSLVNPLLWDASKRLSDHLALNVHPQGWPAESLGYHVYNWSFVGPAFIAWQNNRENSPLEDLAPQLINIVHATSSGTVAIPTMNEMVGIKPDLSDDGLNLGSGLFSMALRVYPDSQKPYIKWMHDYVKEANLYSVLYYPEKLEALSPEKAKWNTYADTTHGVVVHRNGFNGKNDIVTLINASQKRVAGHKGPDVNTFRVIGMGVPFIIGGGRTNLIAGQSNLFPGKVSPDQKGDLNEAGELLEFEINPEGTSTALVKGSSTGVDNHIRKWMVDYSDKSGAEAVIVISDHSNNGKVWRINTPSFNEVNISENSFILTTPEGHTLKAVILSNSKNPHSITTGLLRYGGQTVRHNTGIQYDNKRYPESRFVDVEIDKEVTVVMTIQPKGKPHPPIDLPHKDKITIGNLSLTIDN